MRDPKTEPRPGDVMRGFNGSRMEIRSVRKVTETHVCYSRGDTYRDPAAYISGRPRAVFLAWAATATVVGRCEYEYE